MVGSLLIIAAMLASYAFGTWIGGRRNASEAKIATATRVILLTHRKCPQWHECSFFAKVQRLYGIGELSDDDEEDDG